MSDNNRIFRYEYKYMLDAMNRESLRLRAEGTLLPDSHVSADGSYEIRSLYFDSAFDRCYYENENGIDPRSKFRIRIYNGDTSYISLEKKSKINGMCSKKSCRISEEECRKLMQGTLTDSRGEEVLSELLSENMIPKVIVSYTRVPFVYPAGNVRVTFDSDISSSSRIETFLDKTIAVRPILKTGESIMEVKWDDIIPSYIKQVLQLEGLQWTNFSKYYLCRKFHT